MTHPDVLTCECPCDGCPSRLRCRDQRLACAQFSMFMADEPAKRWRLAPRQPTRELYSAALGERPNGRPRKRGPGRPIKPIPPRATGELLRDMAERGERDRGGRGPIVESQRATQLADLGIDKHEASRVMALLKGEVFR
jgi:hypothetical protein